MSVRASPHKADVDVQTCGTTSRNDQQPQRRALSIAAESCAAPRRYPYTYPDSYRRPPDRGPACRNESEHAWISLVPTCLS